MFLHVLIGAVIDGIRDVLAELFGARLKAFLSRLADRACKGSRKTRRKRADKRGRH
jgi:hypothetical protein